jgi:hypothetical protein
MDVSPPPERHGGSQPKLPQLPLPLAATACAAGRSLRSAAAPLLSDMTWLLVWQRVSGTLFFLIDENDKSFIFFQKKYHIIFLLR